MPYVIECRSSSLVASSALTYIKLLTCGSSNSIKQLSDFHKLCQKKLLKKDMEKLIDKICEMAKIMQQSVNVEDGASTKDKDRLTQLEIENKGLRELLEICSTARSRILDNIDRDAKACQTGKDGDELADEKQETEDDEKQREKTPVNRESL